MKSGDIVSIIGWNGSVEPPFWAVDSGKMHLIREGEVVLIIEEKAKIENNEFTIFMWNNELFSIAADYNGWWETVFC